MVKQSKKIYSDLINKIALVLLVNQAMLLLLSTVIATLEAVLKLEYGETNALDFAFRAGECLVYFVSFVLPVNIFKKMNKNTEDDVYIQKSSKKSSFAEGVYILGIGLGVTFLATCLDHLLVNAFSDYSEFSKEYLWSAQLDKPYQVIIYFVYCAIVPSIAEELLFRGTICKSLEIYGKKTAIFLSAVLFSLMHSNVEQLLYSFVAGIFLSWLFVETKNVIYPIIFHLINNSLSVVGDIISVKCSPDAYGVYTGVSTAVVLVFMAVGIFGYFAYSERGRSIFKKDVIQTDKNEAEVPLLSIKEKISGFFTARMVLFVLYSIVTMIYYIYLSTQLI